MFIKLRNKFLILNMSITSVVMIAAFAIIYFITYNNIHSENLKKLNSLSSGKQITIHSEEQNKLDASPSDKPIAITGVGLPADKEKETFSTLANFSLGDSLSFNIEVDADGRILGINSFIALPDEAYYKAAETAWSDKKDNSTITLEGKQWQYTITPMLMHVIISGQPYTSIEGKYQITFLDVTESKNTLLALLTTLLLVGLIMLFVIFIISLYFANRAIKPIAETWEKQKQFVADASHELKTPLTIINANYDALLANQNESIKSQIKWLDYIRIGSDRMAKLINDLLSLAKIEDVNLKAQKRPFNISNAINDVILSMEALVIEKGIKLRHAIEPDIIIKGDPERVKQVVTILFDNAVKYTNNNGQIDILLKKAKNKIIYSIKNSGKGIAKQDLPKVFDRFYRADPSRTQETGGYGLGLSIAKTIIDRLGGKINVTSVENECTTFTFTLGL